MKHIALTLTALLLAASAYAQGTVNFANRGAGWTARVTYAGDPALAAGPAGAEFWGQLLVGAPGGALAPAGNPTEFLSASDAVKGYITAGGVIDTGVAAGSPAQVQMVAWHKSLGNDYAAAKAQGLGGWGESGTITVTTGGAGQPPSLPAALGSAGGTPDTTLQAFEISTLVPEPSIAALGLLGVGLLLIRRKK
jgi:hypothetical protein